MSKHTSKQAATPPTKAGPPTVQQPPDNEAAKAEALHILSEALGRAIGVLTGSMPATQPLVINPVSDPDLLDHEGVRVLLKLPSIRTVHHLRRRGKIPHQRAHYRCIRYSRTKVLAAWERLERRAFTERA